MQRLIKIKRPRISFILVDYVGLLVFLSPESVLMLTEVQQRHRIKRVATETRRARATMKLQMTACVCVSGDSGDSGLGIEKRKALRFADRQSSNCCCGEIHWNQFLPM